MSNIELLADSRAEAINGGFFLRPLVVKKISVTQDSSVWISGTNIGSNNITTGNSSTASIL
jgi:hypothetical protein